MKCAPFSVLCVACGFLLCCVANPACAQVEAKLVLSQRVIQPLEPAYAVATLTNNSPQPLTIRTKMISGLLLRKGATGPWRDCDDSVGGQSTPIERALQLRPGLNELTFPVIGPTGNSGHVFKNPDRYELKCFFCEKIDSAVQQLEVVPVPANDAAAMNYLLSHPLYHYFVPHAPLLEATPSHKITDPERDLQNFLLKFPKSRYGCWAKLAMLYVRETVVRERLELQAKSDRGAALQEVELALNGLAVSLPVPLKSYAWMQAGMIAIERGDRVAGLYWDKARSAAQNSGLQQIIDCLKLQYSNAISSIPAPETSGQSIISSLEAQHYDTRGFLPNLQKSDPKEWDAYLQQLGKLSTQRRQGAISEQEYYTRQAELLRSFILRLSKPLATEEWSKLQKQYSTEHKVPR